MVRLTIKVKPGASRDEMFVDSSSNITVRIKAKPIQGEANEYLVNYLAEAFNISRSLIQIEKGATSLTKRIAINTDEDSIHKQLDKFRK